MMLKEGLLRLLYFFKRMGKKILITGGAAGKGLVLLRELASQADNFVYFTYCHSAGSALKLMTEFKNTQALRCDFTDAYSLSAFIERLSDIALDVVIHTAKVAVEATDISPVLLYEKKFQIQLRPILLITHEILKKFRQQQSGTILLMVSNTSVSSAFDNTSVELAENMYLIGLSRIWAHENANYNIRSEVLSLPSDSTVFSETFLFFLNKLITEKANTDENSTTSSLVTEAVRRVEEWN